MFNHYISFCTSLTCALVKGGLLFNLQQDFDEVCASVFFYCSNLKVI